jgi:hypothetical protein
MIMKLLCASHDGRHCELLFGYSLLGVDVKAGSKSDGASIPRIFWVIYPPFGRYWIEAFTHDFLYKYTNWTEKQCDQWLLRAILAAGINKFTCYAFYCALRAFGFLAFRADRGSPLTGEA